MTVGYNVVVARDKRVNQPDPTHLLSQDHRDFVGKKISGACDGF